MLIKKIGRDVLNNSKISDIRSFFLKIPFTVLLYGSRNFFEKINESHLILELFQYNNSKVIYKK